MPVTEVVQLQAPARVWLSVILIGLALGAGRAALAQATGGVILSGEVYQMGTQPLLTPQSDSSPVVLRSFVAEGEHVKAGEVVLAHLFWPAPQRSPAAHWPHKRRAWPVTQLTRNWWAPLTRM